MRDKGERSGKVDVKMHGGHGGMSSCNPMRERGGKEDRKWRYGGEWAGEVLRQPEATKKKKKKKKKRGIRKNGKVRRTTRS